MRYGDSNTFHGLRVVNERRCAESFHPIEAWSPTDWMTAVAGEVGEAANLIKKLRRIESDGLDTPQNREMIAWLRPEQRAKDGVPLETVQLAEVVKAELCRRIGHEIADVVIYLDLLASRLGIDMGRAVIEKFNMTSAKIGSKETLPY